MRRLSSVILLLGFAGALFSQSPHGSDLKIDCAACHTPDGWEVSYKAVQFNHDSTRFALSGRHTSVDCRSCHISMIFSDAGTECIDCHTDIHNQTVGMDCARCHTPQNWLVDNITELHQDNGFPLVGAHATASCNQCHVSETALRFDRIGNDCINCHADDYASTTNPNHGDAGYSTDCIICHDVTALDWSSQNINHNFFPLTKGHDIADCASCHTSGSYSNTPTDCAACHQADYAGALNPNHVNANFPTDCASCHTTDPGWMPATFTQHDADYFPIYSGEHEGEWDQCMDCHTDPSNFAVFSCTICHQNPETNEEHDDVNGYIYESSACLACHPTGSAEGIFDHNSTHFPLTGAHTTVNCLQCHASGYAGTPTDCASCHTDQYNQTDNPSHTALGLSTDCAVCHTTAPGWMPASFANHNDYYALNGAHAVIANECATCHNGDYNNTPNTCAGCHTDDYNNTNNPNHVALNFSTDCTDCHGENTWVPSTFDHDSQHFPIYSGEHEGEWNQCTDCHTNTSNYAEFTCITCHTNPDTDEEHDGVGGYSYNSPACLACHPTGDANLIFDHNTTNFPLTGTHTTTACIECHADGYQGTPTNCVDCHVDKYNQTHNPNHAAVGISTDCAICHTTGPWWSPATFPNHNDYHALNGAHASIADNCAACHHGDYNNTPTTCAGCHTDEYNLTSAPDHQVNQFPTDCATCHTENTWAPSTFDHNAHYPFTGAHVAIANDCVACHNGDYANTPNTCAGCHTDEYNNSVNPNHIALGLPTDCDMCHTTAPDWAPATFTIHNNYYTLNGAHAAIANDCATCHNGDYTNTPNTCFGCHSADYNTTASPNHAAAQFSTNCTDCHGENAWVPSTFDHDAQYFPIYSGQHEGEWNQCLDCHTNPSNYAEFTCITCHTNPETNNEHNGVGGYSYNSTACLACHPNGDADLIFDHNTTNFPLTGEHATAECLQCHATGFIGTSTNCVDCHTDQFNQAANPNHVALGFSMDCAACHTTQQGWSPAALANHNDFYALNGAHGAIANDCAACHNGDYNNTPNTCNGCHTDNYNQTTNPNHAAAQFPTDCASCHTESAWAPSTFNHDAYYSFTGAHVAIADDCAACHHGDYANTPTTCAGCHTDHFNQTTNPNHVALGFSDDCVSCHTTDPGWSPATFASHNDYYALNGAHGAIANDCAACHNGDYNNTPNTCNGCHAADYNQTTDPNHATAQFPTDCALCHTESAWAPSNFDHYAIYPFTGAHVAIADDCAACHHGDYTNTPTTCAGCHTDHFNQTTNPNHVALGFSDDCASCHTTDPGWSPATFANHNDYYALNGAHGAIANDCATCHNDNYNNTPNTCNGCHAADYNQTSNPNHAAAQFPTDCATCHTESAWAPSTFDHNAIYPFTGAHVAIADDCAACHQGDYNNTPNTCAGCHTTHYNQSTNPNHLALGLPTDCDMCHSTEPGWAPATFTIHNDYYALNGAHAVIANDCATCHNGNYNNTPNTCNGCHASDYSMTTNPNHATAQFPTDCALCHTESAWAPSTFDHNAVYPFTGAHVAIANDCAACHQGDYNNTPNTCAGCHTTHYNQSTNPNHLALGLPTDCDMCHSTEPGWAPAIFTIHNDYYALNGAHAVIANDCATCHNGNYNNTPNTCNGCHASDYSMTSNPNHATAQFPTDCALCHTENTWSPATFDHNTVYPFTGAHIPLANNCAVCHQGDYNNTPNSCEGCHMPHYSQSSNPNHTALGIPNDCDMCHTTAPDWMPATFPIHNNYYQLVGAHALIANDCAECHNGNYNNTPNTCFGCHATDYNATTNPNHLAGQFPTDCEQCHTQNTWVPSTFNHNSVYPFTGAHIPIANNCALCHQGNYNNTPNTCEGCHLPDFNQSLNPNHMSLGIPTDCDMCHTTAPNWSPATFPIHNSYYQLNGAHAAIANNCAQCHNGNYINTPNTCFGCHAPDYNSANDPNHISAQFPTTCANCHSENAWTPATFDHDNMYFPIYSGKHDGEWNQCVDCHTVPGNFSLFSCIDCHEHDNQQQVDNDHDEVSGYTYTSAACYSCHPNGED